ncbi:MAG TPA: glycoside hydrolase family 3 N-terminal domain-containing protein [Candidatus Acidoferrum sp.]|nr:glycoside hydrolase family 3 N-terminal domain-containing protein [Candidatus Acidoferrum sp.]
MRQAAGAGLLVLSFAFSFRAAAQRRSAGDNLPVYRQGSAPIERRIDDLMRRMTIEEKVRQLDMYSGADALMSEHSDSTHATPDAVFQPEKARALWGSLGVGALHDLNPTPEQSNAIQKWVISHDRLGIPVLFIEEGLHGFDTGTVFPSPIGLGSTWDRELLRQTGGAIAAEARATGVDMILAPVLNLARDPRWGRVEETYGEDPYLASQLGLAYVRGAQGKSLDADDTVIAEPKHFAAYEAGEGGTNTSPVDIGERELRTIMLAPFETAVREGHAMSVMAAYNEVDGIPMTDDPFLLKTVLRQEWGLKGFVLSDLGAIERLYSAHRVAASPEDAACMAIRSGVDMQFYDFPHDVFQKALIGCVRNGTLPEADVDRAVRSVLRAKFMLGLFDHPFVDPSLNQKAHRAAQHLAASMNAALESMTLLKNDDHLLPLSKELKRIAVIGPNGDVARYGDYERENNGEHISILQGIRDLLPGTTVTFSDGKDIPAAVASAQGADAVVMGLGEREGISGEGFDRSSLGLPGNQEQLLEAVAATGKPVVLVLENGRPLTIRWAKQHIPAILEAWYPGEFGGKAIAETLFGDYNPGGRLAVTFPQTAGQLPDDYDADPSRVWKYIDSDGKPLFPFGFGLSYTTFRYDELSAQAPRPGSHDDIQVSVNVTNTGERAGDEIAQVYLREDVSSVETAARALKGFSRIRLNPGERQTVTFNIPQEQIAVWNADKKWAIEAGEYTVWVGGSSEATLSTKFYLRP